jgi:hypothetical protein
VNVDWECAIAITRLHRAINERCEAEHKKTKQQGKFARRSIAQKARYRRSK